MYGFFFDLLIAAVYAAIDSDKLTLGEPAFCSATSLDSVSLAFALG